MRILLLSAKMDLNTDYFNKCGVFENYQCEEVDYMKLPRTSYLSTMPRRFE